MSQQEKDLLDDDDDFQPAPAAAEGTTGPTPPPLSAAEKGTRHKSSEEISSQVQRVQSQLLELQRQQEEVEKQRRDLEELSRKQREFDDGRDEVLEKLTRGLVVLERQEIEVEREAEQIKLIRKQFSEQLDQVKEIRAEEWPSEDLHDELTRALAVIDQANATHLQAKARLAILQEDVMNHPGEEVEYEEESFASARPGFGEMVKTGFAFALPFMIFISLLIMLAIFVIYNTPVD